MSKVGQLFSSSGGFVQGGEGGWGLRTGVWFEGDVVIILLFLSLYDRLLLWVCSWYILVSLKELLFQNAFESSSFRVFWKRLYEMQMIKEGSLDKAPRLSIRIVIWILPSDTVFVNSIRISPNTETAMLSKEAHLGEVWGDAAGQIRCDTLDHLLAGILFLLNCVFVLRLKLWSGVRIYSNTSQLKMLMPCTLFDERIHQGLRKGGHGQSCQLLPPKAPLWTRFYLWTKIAPRFGHLTLTSDCSSSGNSLVGAKSEREKASQRWPVRGGSSKSNWEQKH